MSFLPILGQILSLGPHLICPLPIILFSFNWSKILSLGEELEKKRFFLRRRVSQELPLTFYYTIPTLMTLMKKPLEVIVGKGKNADDHLFSFSHNVSTLPNTNFNFFSYIYFAICQCFQFGPVKNFVIW